MSTTLALSIVLSLSAAAEQDAPDRLITNQGVELRSDERVFVLFAALNALGFSEETQRKGPPLRAPVFHPIRVEVRDALRKLDADKLNGIRNMFEQNPAEIEVYLEAILASGSGDKMSPEAKKVASAVDVLDQFRQKAELVKLFDAIASEQRTVAKDLKTRLDKDFAEANKMLGLGEIRAPASLVVVPNPLDAHDAVRVVETKDRTYLVTGPGFPQAERAVLDAVLTAALKKPIEAAWSSAGGQKYAKAWESARSSPRVAKRFADGKSYAAATFAKIVAFKVRAKVEGKGSKDAEDDFADELANKEGLKWSRAALHALDGWDGGEPFEAALSKGMARSSP